MSNPKATMWNRKGGDKQGLANLSAALCALVHRTGSITITSAELKAMAGGIGLRARYEPDGSMTLWTYDVVEDIKGIANEHRD